MTVSTLPPRPPLPPASILGVGAVTSLGRDLDAIARELAQPARAFTDNLPVSDAILADPLLGKMRRADRFIKMATLATIDAWESAKPACAGGSMDRVGLILSSGFGPHCRGFRFLDGLLDFGDSAALPTDFSHSVHGAASAYITQHIDLRGPSLSITDFEIGFESAVLTAQCWLAEDACDRVIVGGVEELGQVMAHCAARMLPRDTGFPLGEGAVFMVLGPALAGPFTLDAAAIPSTVDLLILEDPAPPFRTGGPPSATASQAATVAGHFGHCAGTGAFQCLGGYLSLRGGVPLGRILGSPGSRPHDKSNGLARNASDGSGEARIPVHPVNRFGLSPDPGAAAPTRPVDTVASSVSSSDASSATLILARQT